MRRCFTVPARVASTPIDTSAYPTALRAMEDRSLSMMRDVCEDALEFWHAHGGDEQEIAETERTRDALAAALAEPDEPPPPLDVLADDYARRWIAADSTAREFLRDEAASFSEEMRQSVNAAVVRMRSAA